MEGRSTIPPRLPGRFLTVQTPLALLNGTGKRAAIRSPRLNASRPPFVAQRFCPLVPGGRSRHRRRTPHSYPSTLGPWFIALVELCSSFRFDQLLSSDPPPQIPTLHSHTSRTPFRSAPPPPRSTWPCPLGAEVLGDPGAEDPAGVGSETTAVACCTAAKVSHSSPSLRLSHHAGSTSSYGHA
jgi:hypothetical protein